MGREGLYLYRHLRDVGFEPIACASCAVHVVLSRDSPVVSGGVRMRNKRIQPTLGFFLAIRVCGPGSVLRAGTIWAV